MKYLLSIFIIYLSNLYMYPYLNILLFFSFHLLHPSPYISPFSLHPPHLPLINLKIPPLIPINFQISLLIIIKFFIIIISITQIWLVLFTLLCIVIYYKLTITKVNELFWRGTGYCIGWLNKRHFNILWQWKNKRLFLMISNRFTV